ncbi:hypothetical protein COOONC_12628 [Cooperia oncophora]
MHSLEIHSSGIVPRIVTRVQHLRLLTRYGTMLFRTHNSYTLPKLYVDDRCQTPSLLSPYTLSARDQQIRLYCQTLIGLIHDLHNKSPKSSSRLLRRVQRILGIETRINLAEDGKSHFEHNVQLFSKWKSDVL